MVGFVIGAVLLWLGQKPAEPIGYRAERLTSAEKPHAKVTRPALGMRLAAYIRSGPSQRTAMFIFRKRLELPDQSRSPAAAGRAHPDRRAPFRQRPSPEGPLSGGLEQAVFGIGCFWGVERKFWQLGDGVW